MALVIFWAVCAFIASVAAYSKGLNGRVWFWWSLLLGPLGIVLVLVVPKNTRAVEADRMSSEGLRKCPYCAELIKMEAIKCRHCGSMLEKSAKDA